MAKDRLLPARKWFLETVNSLRSHVRNNDDNVKSDAKINERSGTNRNVLHGCNM